MSIQAPDIEMGSSGAQLVNLEAAAPHVSDAAADGKVNVELHGSGDDSKDSAIQTSDALGSGDKGLKLGTAEHVAIPTELAARAATLGSRWNWLNWTWGIVFTMLLPVAGTILWWGLIPVGSPTGGFSDKWVWVFILNPISCAFASYLLISLFLTALDEKRPWRPLKCYLPIMTAVYFAQVLIPGLVVLFYKTYELLAMPSLASTYLITIIGIRLTPRAWASCDDRGDYLKAVKVFTKVAIVVHVYTGVLAGYTIANASIASGPGQGMLTVALTIICFICKKVLLALTDPISLDTAMLIAGFWLENLTDVFITLAFPTAEAFGVTFGIIFAQRVAENMAYLWFQLDIWFAFRVWIKGKFKSEQAMAIEEDLPEYEDDRGHSAHHPGYRRRQLRFLSLKLFSQVASYIYFLGVVPVLRYGPQKELFPYQSPENEFSTFIGLIDSRLDRDMHFLEDTNFRAAMSFSVFQIIAVLIAGAIIWAWMLIYHRDILRQVRERYNLAVVRAGHYGLILIILVSNALVATSFMQVYYRVYFM